MAKINDTTTFPNTTAALDDHVIGTDISDTGNSADGEVVTFTIQSMLEASALMTAGAVGTFVFARSTAGSDIAFGSTIAGSSLVPTSAAAGFDDIAGMDDKGAANYFDSGSALAGTWRCLGYYDHQSIDLDTSDTTGGGVSYFYGATLWQRTA